MLRRSVLSLILLTSALLAATAPTAVTTLDSIGMTVSDLDRSVDFYTRILNFTKVSESEVDGPDYEAAQALGVTLTAPGWT